MSGYQQRWLIKSWEDNSDGILTTKYAPKVLQYRVKMEYSGLPETHPNYLPEWSKWRDVEEVTERD